MQSDLPASASETATPTRLFPIIGSPVASVFSPPAFNAWFAAHAPDCHMMALEIPPEGLASFLDVMRHSPSLIGCSVTYPHKQTAFEAVDARTERAARLGGLNTIRREADGRLTGDATDGEAMCRAILSGGGRIEGASAQILGAGGGSGQAIADALCSAGLARIGLEDRDSMRETQIRKMLRTHWPGIDFMAAGARSDILINATTLGKNADDPCPFCLEAIGAAQVICDVVTGAKMPKLVTQALRQAKLTITGSDMGRGQLRPQLAFLGFGSDEHPLPD